MADETFEIKPCPLCGKSHNYLLNVQRSKYFFGVKDSPMGKVRKIRRLLTCPQKNEMFEGVLELKEDDRGRIGTIHVKGVVEEGKNEKEK